MGDICRLMHYLWNQSGKTSQNRYLLSDYDGDIHKKYDYLIIMIYISNSNNRVYINVYGKLHVCFGRTRRTRKTNAEKEEEVEERALIQGWS